MDLRAHEKPHQGPRQPRRLERLKTCPSGFPRDWEYVEYLRQKDYCCWHRVPDTFFQGDHWLDDMQPMLLAAKPMMDMMNSVIDDYE